VLEPVDKQVDGAVAELPHRLAVERQRISILLFCHPSASSHGGGGCL
jgi:hypothetical protein